MMLFADIIFRSVTGSLPPVGEPFFPRLGIAPGDRQCPELRSSGGEEVHGGAVGRPQERALDSGDGCRDGIPGAGECNIDHAERVPAVTGGGRIDGAWN